MTPLRCAALAALVLLPAAAVAGARPSDATHAVAPTPQLTAEPRAVGPGETLTLEGRGFPSNARIALLAGPSGAKAERIGGAETGRRGRFDATIRIRARSDAGAFVVRACFDACRVKASARFRIVAP